MSSSITVPSITDDEFATEIASGVVAVDFTAAWCPPCRMMKPIVEEVARDYAGSIRVLQMDTDANPATMVNLGVRGLPTLLVFRDGELVERIIGAIPLTPLLERLRRLTPKATA
jgi:thioredoxin 1